MRNNKTLEAKIVESWFWIDMSYAGDQEVMFSPSFYKSLTPVVKIHWSLLGFSGFTRLFIPLCDDQIGGAIVTRILILFVARTP